MKTLLFTLEYPPFKGGVANYYGNLAKHWSKIAAAHLGLNERDEASKLTVLNNNNGALLKKWVYPQWIPSFLQLSSVVKKQNIKHIIVGHILPLGTVACWHYKKTGIPYSVVLHGMDFALAMKPGRKQIMAKRILRNATNIICSNKYTAELVYKHLGKEVSGKIFVVHPGINPQVEIDESKLEQIRRQYNTDNKNVIFSCGRLEERKGFQNVIKLMPEISQSILDAHYFIAGDGPLKMEILESSMNNKNITYLGRISDAERDAWISLCDLFVMPSYSNGADFEGFGIVYLEANILKKPVIAGNSGGVPEAVEDGVSGLLVEPQDLNAIKEAIIKILSNPSLREKLGRCGQDRAIEKFNWPKQVTQFYKIINR